MKRTFPRVLPALLLLLALTACTGGEIVGIYIAVQPDGSGTITARALVESPAQSPAETAAAKGITWTKRAALVYAQGALGKLDELSFGDTSLSIESRLDARKITVRLTRSKDAAWVKALVPEKKVRRDLATVYDPLGKTKEIGDTLRLELDLPGVVNGSSVLPTARGVEAGRDGKRAWLTIPVETALESGDALSWDITWN
jgi:hypothetical protein